MKYNYVTKSVKNIGPDLTAFKMSTTNEMNQDFGGELKLYISINS